MKTLALALAVLLTLAGSPAAAEGEYAPVPTTRRELDLRIAALDAERAAIKTKGAKVATFVGLGTILLGVAPLVVGITASYPYGDDYPRAAGGVVSGSTLMGIGLFTALAAGLVWNERVKDRNEIDAERDVLIERRAGLVDALSRLEVRSAVRDEAHFVTLGFRF